MLERADRRLWAARLDPSAVIGFAAGQTITLAVVLGPILGQPWLNGFRNYFSSDQFAYAAIATNVSQGKLALVEPFNETGQLFYPSAWYFVIGMFSRTGSLMSFSALPSPVPRSAGSGIW